MSRPPVASPTLAIVIPAWRGEHFATALDSLRKQTDRRFRVYVGDDASPDDLRSPAADAARDLDLVYHRFPSNLGSSDLVAHWHRCIALSGDEPWIWLFSDDDVADPGCVAAFHRHLDSGETGATLLRFDVEIIDGEGRALGRPSPHPDRESAPELIAALLADRKRFWGAPDHIFPRAVFARTGGFVPYPRGLFSDHATWVRFAGEGHVRTLPDARVRFRRHARAISSGLTDPHGADHTALSLRFLAEMMAETRRLAPARLATHRRLARARFFQLLAWRRPPLRADEIPALARFGAAHFGGGVALHFLRLHLPGLRRALRAAPGLRLVARWRHRRGLRRTGPRPATV